MAADLPCSAGRDGRLTLFRGTWQPTYPVPRGVTADLPCSAGRDGRLTLCCGGVRQLAGVLYEGSEESVMAVLVVPLRRYGLHAHQDVRHRLKRHLRHVRCKKNKTHVHCTCTHACTGITGQTSDDVRSYTSHTICISTHAYITIYRHTLYKL